MDFSTINCQASWVLQPANTLFAAGAATANILEVGTDLPYLMICVNRLIAAAVRNLSGSPSHLVKRSQPKVDLLSSC